MKNKNEIEPRKPPKMASSGNDRPNLKICIDNVEESSDIGMSDCEDEDLVVNTNVDDKSFDDEEDENGRVEVENSNTEKTEAGFRYQQTGREEYVKRKTDEHAKKSRSTHSMKKVDDDELQKLYESLGVAQPHASADKSERGLRLDAVHVRGVEKMTTADVLKYFEKFAPETVEWIDDRSCNVVCQDTFTAARAIMDLTFDPDRDMSDEANTEGDKRKKSSSAAEGSDASKKTSSDSSESGDDDHLDLMADVEDCAKPSSKTAKEKEEEEDEEEEGEVRESSTSNDGSLDRAKLHSAKSMPRSELVTPPPGRWRHGRPCSKADHLFLRFATKADRKVSGSKEESSSLQEKRPSNFGGSKGLISHTRKRRLRAVEMNKEDEGMDEDIDLDEAVGLVTRPHRVSAVSAGHIPDETLFDLHTKDAQTQRLKTARLQRQMKWSGDEDAELELDDVVPPPPKRSMRMYADDVEEELRGKRSRGASSGAMAMDTSSLRQSSVHSRLQLGARQRQSDQHATWRDDSWRRPVTSERTQPVYEWDDDVDDEEEEDMNESGPWVRGAATWRDQDEPARPQPQQTANLPKRNGIWNRNPDWDQNRYKDLDAPPEESDGGWHLPSRDVDFTGRGAGNTSNGEEEEGEVEDDDSDFGSRSRVKDRRWQRRTDTSEGGSAGDLRRKLDSRRREYSTAAW